MPDSLVYTGDLNRLEIRQLGGSGTAIVLLELLNLVVDSKISQPKKVEAIYSNLPADKVAAIKKRDGADSSWP